MGLVGSPVTRVEDDRLLTGAGRYVDDVVVADMLHAAFVRSPLPHGRVTAIDADAARALPGVHAVLTGAEIAAQTHPFVGVLALRGLHDPHFPCMATDTVRMVGDPVAVVVAESRRVAEDGCALVEVEYDALPAVASSDAALAPGAPRIWPTVHGNVLHHAVDDHGDVDAVFARADRVITERFSQHRQSNQPMEARACLAEVDPRTGKVLYRSTTQSSHMMKWMLALIGARLPVGERLRRLAAHPRRLAAVVRGGREFVAATPVILDAARAMAPQFARQIRRDPRRVVALLASVLDLIAQHPDERPEVVTGDIGGAFGAKALITREEIAVYAVARMLRRSVKWTEDRNEHLLVGGQAREETAEVQMAVTDAGTVLGMKVDLVMDSGAYHGFPYGAPFFARMASITIPGPYRLQALRFATTVAVTNKATYIPYRGPWAVETWIRERMLDVVARELGLTPEEIRLRNMVGEEELPRTMVTGPTLDVRMSAKTTLRRAVEVCDLPALRREQAEARARGRRVGVGIATFIEAAPGPRGYYDHIVPGLSPFGVLEPARVELDSGGRVVVHTPQIPHGQSHETTLAQVAASELGIGMEQVEVRFGDTRTTPLAFFGTGGSRSAALAGGAVTIGSRTLRRHLLDIAGDLMEVAPGDLEIVGGRVAVVGSPSTSVGLDAVARHARRSGAAERLRVEERWDAGEGGWTQATHVCVVEIDPATGMVTIPRYVVVEDCGEIINPAVVDGQIRGGVAQGVGAVLYEHAPYDADGQFQAGTFMDFLIPTCSEIPEVEIHHVETPSSITANFRGVGEGGLICSPAAITNAVADAVADLGVRITEQHLPPSRILELLGVITPDPVASTR